MVVIDICMNETTRHATDPVAIEAACGNAALKRIANRGDAVTRAPGASQTGAK